MYIPFISEIGQMLSTFVGLFTNSASENVAKHIGAYSKENEKQFRLDNNLQVSINTPKFDLPTGKNGAGALTKFNA